MIAPGSRRREPDIEGGRCLASLSYSDRSSDVIVATDRSGGHWVERREDSDTVPETTVAATPDTLAVASATTPDAAGVEILPPDESWGGLTGAS